ncbi:hypothetical protein ACLMJK_002846 [Lecanora helva]
MIGYVRGPFNVLSDLYLLILPLPAVWQLHLPFRARLGLAAVFLTGFLACIASIFGLYYRIVLYRSADITWNLAPVLTTLIIELNVGTICASLPSLAAFYRHHRLKPPQLAAVKNFSAKMNPFKASRKTDIGLLETSILGSVEGEGKFLKTGDLTNVSGTIDIKDTETTSSASTPASGALSQS